MEGIYHSKAEVDRLYIKRRNGRRGVVELETVYSVTIVGLSEYINPLPANVENMVSS
jgi:hypothetical protein